MVVEMLQVGLLLACLFAVGTFCDRLGCPALIGEIVVGMILGPGMLDIVPHAEMIILVGQLGLVLLVLEGGLHIELVTLRKVGVKAVAVALTGTALPIVITIAVFGWNPDFSFKESLVAGTSLSSTAIGMAAKMMQDMGLLDTYLGQLICCAAMVDDVASLILLAMISSTAGTAQGGSEAGWGPEEGVWSVMLPLISSVVFVGLTCGIASVMPTVVYTALPILPGYGASASAIDGPSDGYPAEVARLAPELAPVVLGLVLGTTAGFVAAAFYARTTFLLGAFMAGVCFSSIPEAVEAFDKWVTPVGAWTSRLFFGSIGFEVPVKDMFDPQAMYYGLLLSAVAVLSKVTCIPSACSTHY